MLTRLPSFPKLVAHLEAFRHVTSRDLFEADPARFTNFHKQVGNWLVDYSKQRVTSETLALLTSLAQEAQVLEARDAMFAGEAFNRTEGRPVLHVALRNRSSRPILVDGKDVMPDVRAVLARMRAFTDAVRSGNHRGYTGETITDIVNIGIGGSDLGPAMVAEALKPYWQSGMRAHFVSNVDGTHLAETLRYLDPTRTLFVVASKTFTTQETMTNAASARDWFLKSAKLESAIAKHFVAVSTNQKEVRKFGIDDANMFGFWDWVGGRYSLWGAIGLPIATLIGMSAFEELLAGAHTVDEHFRTMPIDQNVPALLALVGVWNTNFWGHASHAVLPYDQYLALLPAYLQQADMESNGKSTSRDGSRITGYETGPILWGAAGTNGQHAFYQLLHQGTRVVPADFIVAFQSHNPMGDHHAKLLANGLAQTEALMRGKTEAEAASELLARGMPEPMAKKLAPHKVFSGSRPTTTWTTQKITPTALGELLALYEHKIFVQGVIWDVASFDQWGVELGKELASRILGEISSDASIDHHDSSTRAHIERYRALRCS
jgi:glucose-6-phosphate isomerase